MHLKVSRLSIGSFIIASRLLAQEIVFEANFDGSTPVNATVSANANASNLTAGTSIGSWLLPNAAAGVIISDGGSNNAFLFDRVTSGQTNNSAEAVFSRNVSLRSEILSVEMDLYAARQSGNQQVLFVLEDASGQAAYEFRFRLNNTKEILTINNSGNIQQSFPNQLGTNNGFLNPIVNGYLGWSGGTAIRTKVEIVNQVTENNLFTAQLSIDWNGDGDYDDVSEVQNIPFGSRNADVSEITSLRIANSTTANGGAWIDNLSVTAGPAALPDAPAHFNLAKFQNVTVSSERGEWPSQFANDGYVTEENRWRTVAGAATPHWLEIELNTTMTIGSAHIYSGGTFDSILNNFELQYFDGSSFVTIPGTPHNGNNLPENNIVFNSPVTAQRFRLISTDNVVNIRDFALFAPTNDGSAVPIGTDVDLNVAKLRQYVFSSVSGAGYPKLAFDGYTHASSAWLSEDAAGPHELEIHFPRSEQIGGIHLYSGFEGQADTQLQDFEVAYWNGSTWITFDGGSVTGNSEHTLNLQFNTTAATNRITTSHRKRNRSPPQPCRGLVSTWHRCLRSGSSCG